MTVKLLTEHNLEFLSLRGGYTGSSESIYVKMPHCGWKSHAQVYFKVNVEESKTRCEQLYAMRKATFFLN